MQVAQERLLWSLRCYAGRCLGTKLEAALRIWYGKMGETGVTVGSVQTGVLHMIAGTLRRMKALAMRACTQQWVGKVREHKAVAREAEVAAAFPALPAPLVPPADHLHHLWNLRHLYKLFALSYLTSPHTLELRKPMWLIAVVVAVGPVLALYWPCVGPVLARWSTCCVFLRWMTTSRCSRKNSRSDWLCFTNHPWLDVLQ